MTTPKKDGTIYLWLFGAVISMLLGFMAMVWNYTATLNSFVQQNTVDHYEILKRMDKDTSWTRWVHRHQIIPAYEISFDNKDHIKNINRTLVSIDSNLMVSNSNIRRIFFYLRKERDGEGAFDD